MANRRQLKKQIRYICGDVAAECAMAKYLIDGVNRETLDNALRHVAALQEQTLARVSAGFDKVPCDFESQKEYNASKHSFYAKAFTSLRNDFNKRLQEIVKEMNSALPYKKA